MKAETTDEYFNSDIEMHVYENSHTGKNQLPNPPYTGHELMENDIKAKIAQRKQKRKLDFQISYDSSSDDEQSSHAVISLEMKRMKEDFNDKEKDYKEYIGLLEEENESLKSGFFRLKEKLKHYSRFNFALQNQILTSLENSCFCNKGEDEKPSLENGETKQEDLIDLGQDVRISQSSWQRLKTHPNNSIVVKELAMLVWGEDILRFRSVTGRKCPTMMDESPKQPLEPEKLSILHETFRKILVERGCSDENIKRELKLVNKYLREKISDTKRKYRKSLMNIMIEVPQSSQESATEEDS